MRSISPWLTLGLVLLLGCGGQPGPRNDRTGHAARERPEHGDAADLTNPDVGKAPAQAPAAVNGLVARAEGPAAPPAAGKVVERKIVYTADVKLIVKDFAKAEQDLQQLVKEHDGMIARSEVSGSSGEPRSGSWTVRLPVNQFGVFMADVVKVGFPEKNSTDSQDITEEYYDLEARLKNKKVEEERLQMHLEKSTGKLEDILAVERELSRVRGEIEQMEGRRRLLSNLSELTTITVLLQEVKNYVPPQAPTFANNVTSTFSTSLEDLGLFLEDVALFAVALTPWLPVLLVVAVPVWLLVRQLRSRHADAGQVPVALPAEPEPPPT